MIRRSIILLAIAQGTILGTTAYAQVAEGKVKAATVFAISRFIEWPDRARPEKDRDLFYIGLLPESNYAAEFTAYNGKTLDERTVIVIQIRPDTPREDLQRCDLIFGSDSRSLKLIQKKIESAPVLTIADTPPNAKPSKYTGVTLLVRDRRLVFQLSLPTLRKAGIRPKAELLKMADEIHP